MPRKFQFIVFFLSILSYAFVAACPSKLQLGSFRYRRSYDSEFTAPLIAYHVWPALLEDGGVLIKGECVTRRGAVS